VMRPEVALSGAHPGPFTPDSLFALRRLLPTARQA
jgi:hypothetical protein